MAKIVKSIKTMSARPVISKPTPPAATKINPSNPTPEEPKILTSKLDVPETPEGDIIEGIILE